MTKKTSDFAKLAKKLIIKKKGKKKSKFFQLKKEFYDLDSSKEKRK